MASTVHIVETPTRVDVDGDALNLAVTAGINRLQDASDLAGTAGTGKGWVRNAGGAMEWTDLVTNDEAELRFARSYQRSGSAETVDRDSCKTATNAAAGVMYLTRGYFPAATYATVRLGKGGTVGVSGGFAMYFAIYRISDGGLVAQSADVAAEMIAIAANVTGSVTFPFTIPTSGDYWAGWMLASGFTTSPTMVNSGQSLSAVAFEDPAIAARHTTTGLASPPATVTPVNPGGLIRWWFRYDQ